MLTIRAGNWFVPCCIPVYRRIFIWSLLHYINLPETMGNNCNTRMLSKLSTWTIYVCRSFCIHVLVPVRLLRSDNNGLRSPSVADMYIGLSTWTPYCPLLVTWMLWNVSHLGRLTRVSQADQSLQCSLLHHIQCTNVWVALYSSARGFRHVFLTSTGFYTLRIKKQSHVIGYHLVLQDALRKIKIRGWLLQ